MINNAFTPFDIQKALKKGLLYLLIASPFMLVLAVILTIANAPFWLNLLSIVIVGGGVVLVCYAVSLKRADKKKQKSEKDGKFDPFKD